MRRSHARPPTEQPAPPSVSIDDLVNLCEEHFSADEYDISRDEPFATVWVRSHRCGHAVGLQVSQVSRVGVPRSLERVRAKLECGARHPARN